MSDWLTTRQLQHLQRGYRKRVETPIRPKSYPAASASRRRSPAAKPRPRR